MYAPRPFAQRDVRAGRPRSTSGRDERALRVAAEERPAELVRGRARAAGAAARGRSGAAETVTSGELGVERTGRLVAHGEENGDADPREQEHGESDEEGET